jgi:subtilisin family serine protease
MFFLPAPAKPQRRTLFRFSLFCPAMLMCAFFLLPEAAAGQPLQSEVRREFLIKTASRSRATAFIQSGDVILSTQPVLETPSGDWYKLTHYGRGESVSLLVNRFLDSDDLIAFEENVSWSAVGQTASVIGDDDSSGPRPAKPPRLPRRERRDPLLQKVWSLAQVNVEGAWKTNSGSASVLVANIDSGIDYNHQDLINNIWRHPSEVADDGIDNDGNGFVDDTLGWDFVNSDNRPWDDNGHGTHTAGTIGATGGNGVGLSGVAKKVSLLPLKFLSASGEGTTENAVRAIRYAVAAGAQILSNSWGGETYSRALEDAIAFADSQGVLFVAAAGNDASDNDSLPMYPAAYNLPNVLAVAATDRTDALADFSNFGYSSVHLAAPGDFIWSTTPGDKYSVMSGTSMACPMVAGAAALLKSVRSDLNPPEIIDILLDSSDKLPNLLNKVRSSGRLNVEQALRRASSAF